MFADISLKLRQDIEAAVDRLIDQPRDVCAELQFEILLRQAGVEREQLNQNIFTDRLSPAKLDAQENFASPPR